MLSEIIESTVASLPGVWSQVVDKKLMASYRSFNAAALVATCFLGFSAALFPAFFAFRALSELCSAVFKSAMPQSSLVRLGEYTPLERSSDNG